MEEVGGAAISGVASLAASALTHLVSFSSRHDRSYKEQAAETDVWSQGFEDLRRKGEVDEEQYDQYKEIQQTALESGRDYRDSIQAYRDISPLRLSTKLKTKTSVRKKKGKMRKASHRLREHYHGSTSGGSEVSSIAADSGSPPGSALESERIRDWATDVEHNENAVDERSQHLDPRRSERIELPSTTSPIDTSFLSSSAPALLMHDPDATEEDKKVYAHQNNRSRPCRLGPWHPSRGAADTPASPSQPQFHIQQQAPTTCNSTARHEPKPNPDLTAPFRPSITQRRSRRPSPNSPFEQSSSSIRVRSTTPDPSQHQRESLLPDNAHTEPSVVPSSFGHRTSQGPLRFQQLLTADCRPPTLIHPLLLVRASGTQLQAKAKTLPSLLSSLECLNTDHTDPNPSRTFLHYICRKNRIFPV